MSKYRKTIVAVIGAGIAWSYVVIGGPVHISAASGTRRSTWTPGRSPPSMERRPRCER